MTLLVALFIFIALPYALMELLGRLLAGAVSSRWP